jgi:hypothetical protein
MTAIPLGRVNVSAAGTPVQLAAARTPCQHIRAQVIAGLTGKMYLGNATLNSASLAGVIKEFWPNPAGGVSDSLDITADGNQLDLSQYWIDAAVSGEGLLITYWTV